MLKSVVFVLVIGLTASFAQADYFWDGGGADNLWATAANWQDDTMPPATGHQIVIDVPDEGQPVFEAGMDYSYHGIRVGQVSEGTSTLTMTGGTLATSVAPIFLGLGSYDFPATVGIMYFSGGTVNANNGFVLSTYVNSTGILNMSGTAVLNVSPMLQTGDDYRDHLTIACHNEGVLNMDGGTINSEYGMRLSQRSDGHGVVNMTAGTINLGGNLGMSSNEYTPYSEFYLNGGVVNAAGLDMTVNARLDVAGGTMILDGDHTVALQAYIDSGWITGYGGNIGAVVMDYDVSNAGKTTLVGNVNFNSPPQVEAGDYQSILLPDAAQLDATVTDDGKPTDPGAVTLTWSKNSGPGNVSFNPSPNVEDPTATFTVAGFYELQLSATDGEKDACDVVTIYVRANNDPIAHWAFETGSGPTVNDDSANNNEGTLAGDTEPNWVTGWVGSNAMEFFGVGSTNVSSYVDVITDPTAADPNLDNLRYDVTLAAWFRIDDLANAYHPPIIASSNKGWRLYVETAAGDLYGKVTFTPGDTLSGSRTYSTRSMDDGYWHHVVGIYDYLNSKSYLYVDGVLDTTEDNSGILAIYDVPVTIGARKRTDDLTTERSWNGMLDDVRVYSYGLSADQVADLAVMGALIPMVDAGDDQTFSIQDVSLQLDGTLTDDGEPVTATIEWTKASGPGDVDFTDTAIEDPCVTFTEAGIYILRLTADDTMATVYDEVTITVEDPTCQDIINDGLLIMGDISGPEEVPDCYVDLYDFAVFAGNWLRCNDPQNSECEFTY